MIMDNSSTAVATSPLTANIKVSGYATLDDASCGADYANSQVVFNAIGLFCQRIFLSVCIYEEPD